MDDDEFYRRHADAIIRYFRGLFREDVEDLVQETFRRFFEARGRQLEDPRAYLFGIAHHVGCEHVRTLVRDRRIDPDAESMAALDPGPSTIAARRRRERMLHEALRRLPLHHQQAIQLYYWERFSIDEIAQIMELTLTPSGMRDRMCRARELLAQYLAELDETTPLIPPTNDPSDG